MQVITGTIVDLHSLLVDGNTIHFFSLNKSNGEWKNVMYAAVFVQEPPDRSSLRYAGIPVSELEIRFASLSNGLEIEVTVNTDDPIPTGALADLSHQISVSGIALKKREPDPRPQ